ncbi:MAG: DEAD/DEAH box helicase [Treponema sp.]|nr:DEAD/DEAH box helicase [Treponema sp.]
MKYKDFIDNKLHVNFETKIIVNDLDINTILFDYQKDLVKWSLKIGKSAIFADTGLGKTFIQLEWARLVHLKTNKPVLIVSPLAVVRQTINEAEKLSISLSYVKTQSECINDINITNYERIENFDADYFVGIVLDESSILKSFTGAYKKLLIDSFRNTEYKLACSATPAPNDYMELGNHSEFLNVMNLTEMLSMFFIHDGGNTSSWRLKGHATERFWEWVSSWSAIIKNPSDLGYDGTKHILPKLYEKDIIVDSDFVDDKYLLLPLPAETLNDRRLACKSSLENRINAVLEIIKNNPDDIFVIWCNYNDEANELNKRLKGSINVQGSDDPEVKARRLLKFGKNKIKILITKPKIASFGLNWQNCHNMIFASLNDSYEQYYQAVRRCYRFGQENPVNVYRIFSYAESNIIKNIKRKDDEFQYMRRKMSVYVKKYVRENLQIEFKELDKSYNPKIKVEIPNWVISEE